MSINKVTLLGNVAVDPVIRRLDNGKTLANFRIATSETWKDKTTGERKEKTEYHNVVVYNDGLCRVVEQFVKKGTKLYIEGSLATRKWTDKNGQEKYTTEVVLQGYSAQLLLLSPKPQAPVQTSAEDVWGPAPF
jgi:single-strand DNA-binding protein